MEDIQTLEVSKVEIMFKGQESCLLIIKNITDILHYEKQRNDDKY